MQSPSIPDAVTAAPSGERLADALRANLVLLALTAGGTAAGIAAGIATGRDNWPVYLAVVVLGGALVVWLHLRHHLTLATRAGLAVFALAHVAGGMVPAGDGVLYGQWLAEPVVRYDNVQHAWGFGFAGRAAWEVLRARLGAAAHDRLVTWWVVLLAAGALGAVNEVVEWVLTLTIPGTDVGGYDNTARDLVADLAGGAAVGWWTARSLRGPPAATPD